MTTSNGENGSPAGVEARPEPAGSYAAPPPPVYQGQPGPGPGYPVYPQPGPYYGPYQAFPPAPVYYRPEPRRTHPGIVALIVIMVSLMIVTVVGIIIAVTAAVLWSGSDIRVGALTTENRAVALQGATQARVEINKGVGNLTIGGGAQDLLNATFTSNVDTWKPEVNYTVSGQDGYLNVKQPSNNSFGPFLSQVRYDWDLRLKNEVPMNLKLNLGVGNSTLNLAGLALNGLEVKGGIGDTRLDLTGVMPQSMNGTINAGIGKITIRLPQNVGVEVAVNNGLHTVHANGLRLNNNTYYNSAYGQTAATIRLQVNAGIGDIYLEQ